MIGSLYSCVMQAMIGCFRQDDEEDGGKTNGASMLTFFNKKGENKKLQKHKFFRDRCLATVTNL
jgi:hypothetical protein